MTSWLQSHCGFVAFLVLLCCCILFNGVILQGLIRWPGFMHASIDYDLLKKELESVNGSASTYKKGAPVKKVLLFCYMRGGSSVGGEVFNVDPEGLLWYEPLAPFYAAYYGHGYAVKTHPTIYTRNGERVKLDDRGQMLLTNHVTQLFNCDFDQLPPEAWLTRFIVQSKRMRPARRCVIRQAKTKRLHVCPAFSDTRCELHSVNQTAKQRNCPELIAEARRLSGLYPNVTFHQLADILEHVVVARFGSELLKRREIEFFASRFLCLENLRRRASSCATDAEKICKSSAMITVEVNRMKMEDVELILEEDPDVRVIHYVRDPRGIAFSRTNTVNLMLDESTPDVTGEAAFICKRMREDLRVRRSLEERYPGAVLQVRYEDLVENPKGTVLEMFDMLGRVPPPQWQTIFEEPEEELIFGTRRKNSSATVEKWRTGIGKKDKSKIARECLDVLTQLNYALL